MSSSTRTVFASLLLAFAASTAIACTVEAHAPLAEGGGDLPTSLVAGNDGPCVDGTTRACQVELGRRDGVVSCFVGTSTCVEGAWGACGTPEGSSSTIETKQVVAAPAGDDAPSASTKSLSDPSSSKGICATNPCDPTCNGFDERPATVYTATGVQSSWYENNGLFGGSPPGFVNKLVKNPCSSPIDCGYDMHCDTPTRKCVKNAPGWTYTNAQCGSVDVTVGAACLVNNRTTLPVCNRGNVPIATGRTIRLGIKNGDWIRQPECPTGAGALTYCDHILAKPLFPGTCAQVDTCGWSGNAVAFVNIDGAISECPGATNELGCSDNWSDVKVVPCQQVTATNYNPVSYTEKYIAKCPVSARVSWQLLTYDATAPSNGSGASRVKFEVRTAPLLANGTAGTYGALVTAADTAAGDPAACKISGPTPCPKDLFAALGGTPLAHQQALEMKISLLPTPDTLMTPTLRSWQVSYSCIPTE